MGMEGIPKQSKDIEGLEKFVGKDVKINETENTRRLGVAGGPGHVESAANGKLQVLYTDETFGPAGPYDLDKSEVEITDL